MSQFQGKVRGEVKRVRDRKAARLLAAGLSYEEVAQQVGLASHTIANKFHTEPHFVKMVEKYAHKFEENLEERIIEGLTEAEEEAVDTMRDLMTDAQSEEVRFKAAESILDRAGKRGKAAETKQIATLNLNEPLEKALASALSDPGVKQFLDSHPDLVKKLEAPKPEALPAEIIDEDVSEPINEPD